MKNVILGTETIMGTETLRCIKILWKFSSLSILHLFELPAGLRFSH